MGSGDAEKPNRSEELAKPATRVVGAGLGALLASSPVGPEVGAVAGQALSEGLESLVQRFVERRPPLERAMQMLQRADREIERLREEGKEVRAELLDASNDDAAAIFEAAVDAAARSFEEKKGEAIVHLYASIAVDPDVSVADALLYLRLIRTASWRQLVALRFFEADDRREDRELIQLDATAGDMNIHPSLGAELSEMARSLGLLGIEATTGEITDPSDISGGGEITTQLVDKVRPTALGKAVSGFSHLGEIVVPSELDGIAADLSVESDQGRRIV